jgi:hypothetical protein
MGLGISILTMRVTDATNKRIRIETAETTRISNKQRNPDGLGDVEIRKALRILLRLKMGSFLGSLLESESLVG